MLANNTEYDQTAFYNFASFVYQNDILNEALTVRGNNIANTQRLCSSQPDSRSKTKPRRRREWSS